MYDCDLYLNNNFGVILLKIKVLNNFNGFLKFPLSIKSLSGNLSNGFKFTVISCKRESMVDDISRRQTIYTYICNYLINGLKNSKGIKLNKVIYSFGDIINWGKISGYRVINHSSLVNNSDVKRTIFNDHNIKLNYFVSYSLIPYSNNELMVENISLKQIGNIEIISKKGLSIEEYEKIIKKVIKLIEICILRKPYIIDICGESNKLYDNSGLDKIYIPIHIDSYLINKEEFDNKEKKEIISLLDLISNSSFEKIIKKYDIMKPILDSYTEIIESKTNSIRKFLNLVEALETYHSRLITNDMKSFKRRINNVILSNYTISDKEDVESWLMANSKNFITLESRLADLLLANFEIKFDTGEYDIKEYPNIIANTRHYYIHYDEKIKKDRVIIPIEKLDTYNISLFYILEYYIFKELGFTNIDELKKILNDRWGNISTILDLINRSNEM